MKYQNRQSSPLYLLLMGLSLGFAGVAWLVRDSWQVSAVVLVAAAIVFGLSWCFQSLTVSGQKDDLEVRFGPVGLFRTRIPYRQITGFEATTTSLIDGWGVHYIPSRGWTWNLWGFECVKITCGERIIRVGTNDVDGLIGFLDRRLASGGRKQSATSSR